MSAPVSVLKKVKLLELRLRRRVQDLFAGGYRSAFKGQGMIFSDYRKYIPGDDVRAISWPLTARMGEPYIKIFEEEKGALFMIVMDVSGSFDFGSQGIKGDCACELASLLALSAGRNQDRVGLLLFSDEVEHYVPPARGNKHILRIIRDLYSFKRKSLKTNLSPALFFLNRVLKKSCHIFIFSDFVENPLEGYFSSDKGTIVGRGHGKIRELALSSDKGTIVGRGHGKVRELAPLAPLVLLAQRHDIVAGVVCDPFEREFPSLGLMQLEDAETGERRTVDSSSPFFSKQYKNIMEERAESLKKSLQKSGVDSFFIYTDKDIFKQFASFINKRKQNL